jgi:NAD(P)-dependent dehydrogenase (short-subunit alcohol dehydrogenase family)
VVGAVPFRRQCAFAAAKAGVINLSKAMALELAELNIRVNALLPGTVAMPGTKALWSSDDAMNALLSHIPQHRQGEPRDIANAALFLCSDLAGYVTGAALNVDGGWLCGYARDF